MREKVMEDHRIMIQEIVGEVGISTGSCHTILTEDLNLQRVSEGIVHLIPVASCIMSIPQKARQSTKSTTWRFYVVFEMLFEESGQTCGQQRIFSSTMIMPLLIPRMSKLFSSKTTCQLLDRRLTLSTLLHVISGCSPN